MAFQRMENRTLSVPVSHVAGGGLMSEFWQMRDVQKPTKESAFSWIKKDLDFAQREKKPLSVFLPGMWSRLEVQRSVL